jgi:prepilin peptidase CpaA
MWQQVGSILIPTLILIAGVVDDLRSRKVHNKLVLALAGFAALAAFAMWGWHGLLYSLIAALTAIALCVPLVMTGVMGAGDMKLLMAFAIVSSWNSVLWVLVYSLVWGGLLGVFSAVLRGQARLLLASTMSVALFRKQSQFPLHKIPYTIAIFFGWLTELSFNHFGGLL